MMSSEEKKLYFDSYNKIYVRKFGKKELNKIEHKTSP